MSYDRLRIRGNHPAACTCVDCEELRNGSCSELRGVGKPLQRRQRNRQPPERISISFVETDHRGQLHPLTRAAPATPFGTSALNARIARSRKRLLPAVGTTHSGVCGHI